MEKPQITKELKCGIVKGVGMNHSKSGTTLILNISVRLFEKKSTEILSELVRYTNNLLNKERVESIPISLNQRSVFDDIK